jgi:hypothetical protein
MRRKKLRWQCCDKCQITKKFVCPYCDNPDSPNIMDIPVSWKTIVSLYLKKCQMLLCQCCDKCQITEKLVCPYCDNPGSRSMLEMPVSWQTFVSLYLKMSKASVPLLWQMPNYYCFQKACALLLWQRCMALMMYIPLSSKSWNSISRVSAAVTGEKCVWGLYWI